MCVGVLCKGYMSYTVSTNSLVRRNNKEKKKKVW